MKAVAAGDEVAVDALLAAVLTVSHVRRCSVDAVHGDVAGFVDGGQARRSAGVHQIPRKLGLAVHRHVLTAGQAVEIDPVAAVPDEYLEPVVHEAFAMHALADPGLVEQVDGHLLEDSRTNPPEHVLGSVTLEEDRIDPGPVEQLPEHQPRRACTDDDDLRFH